MTGLLDRILDHLAYREQGMTRQSNWWNGTSLPNNTWKSGGTAKFKPGIWLIAFGAGFSANSNGSRVVNFSDTVGDGGRMAPSTRATSSGDTRVSGIRIASFATETTWYISGDQNSGSSLTFYPWYEAICLVPY